MPPRFPNLTPQKLIRILQNNGFLLDHTTGSHYIFYHPESKRRVTVAYHTKDLPRGTMMSILKQAGIALKEILN
jgi:predicted RNA binding protein YcfA (HicA-like mRNA interferase family)